MAPRSRARRVRPRRPSVCCPASWPNGSTPPPGPGLLGLAMALDQPDTNTQGAARVEDFTLPLSERGQAWLLPGIRDPRHAPQLGWPLLADAFIRSSADSGVDVIADMGRAGGADTPVELLAGRCGRDGAGPQPGPDHAAHPRLEALQAIGAHRTRVGLCLIDSGRYSTAEIRKALFGLPVLAELPHAPSDARVLSDGAAAAEFPDQPVHARDGRSGRGDAPDHRPAAVF